MLLEEYRHTRDGLRYGFAVGKVRVLSARLLDRSALERLVDAPSFHEQKRILSDTPYGRFLEQARTPAEVDEALNRALDSAYAFLGEAGLPLPIQRFFRVRHDYTNLKAALKADALGVGLDDLLVDHGTLPRELFSGPLDRLPEPLGALARELSPEVADARADVDLMAIDAAVDRAFHVELHAIADEARSSFLKDLAVRLSDVANLKTMVRAQHAGVSASRLADMLVADGSMSSRDLLTAYRLPRAELLSTLDRRLRLRGAPLASADGVDDLDVIADNVIVDTIKRAKHSEPGPDDIVEYVRARESEVQVLRVALLGKLAGLDSAALHRRMRASFR